MSMISEENKSIIRPKLYRRGVGIFLVNKNKKVFVGQRRDATQAWQLPQGGVDAGESMPTAAYRELFEETGVKKARLLYKSRKWYRYDLPEHLLGKVWKGRFCGQKQKWFLMLFTGDERKDINLQAFNYQEFQQWKWVSPENIVQYASPFKKHVYAGLQKEMIPIIDKLKIES